MWRRRRRRKGGEREGGEGGKGKARISKGGRNVEDENEMINIFIRRELEEVYNKETLTRGSKEDNM